jgi:hypothetical protein
MNPIGNGSSASSIVTTWVKSSFSGPQGNCVEVAHLDDGGIAMRNSRFPDGPALVFTATEWEAFLSGARNGEFGLPA